MTKRRGVLRQPDAWGFPAFEDGTDWSTLFSRTAEWDGRLSTVYARAPIWETKQNHLTVGSFCNRRNIRSGYVPALSVVPTPALLDAIDQRMIRVNFDRIYFEAIVYEDGAVAVWAKYNQILGSHILCYDVAGMPEFAGA